jgi:uncharacterized protein
MQLPQNCFIHPCLYIEMTEQKGRGMFCGEDIAADTLIEVSPVIVLNKEERATLKATLLRDYLFGWEDAGCCTALGYVGIYNHAYTANCDYIKDYANRTIGIKTVRDITAGEELTINYNGSWDDQSELWFDAV